MDPHPRDEATEAVLGDIIAHRSDVVLSFLNDKCTDGLERLDEEASYDDDQTMEEAGHRDDSSGDRMEEEGHRNDGSGDRMEEEGHRDDGSGDRTESGQVYILIKHVLTIAN